MNNSERLLHPMKRVSERRFERISIENAFDEIAAKLRNIVAESGVQSIGMFKGTQTYQNATAAQMLVDWMAALGSSNYFTTTTIDQSSHMVTMGRMGIWNAGKHRLEDSDVALLIGTNPLVSIGGYGLLDFDPVKRLKEAKQRGLKLVVIDPRRTETAMQADCFLQPVPGEDPTILAGLIRIILSNGWEDRAFCAEFAAGVDELRAAVRPFTPEYVERRAGIDAAQLEVAAATFARDARRGIAILGTGTTMAPRSNLSDHLVECLNVLCGRLLRAGEKVPNPGVLAARRPFLAEVIPASRSWESGPKSSTGHGAMFNERMSGILADEMLLTGEGRLRALFVNGANPAVALPNQAKAVAGLKALDLLVSVEPFMTATALLSDYVMPPKLMYERTDVAKPPQLEGFLGGPPFNQYLPALIAAPADSEVIDDWFLYWSLAKRLGLPLSFAGVPLNLNGTPPSTDDLMEILFRDSRVPLDEVRRYPLGKIFDNESEYVQPGNSAVHHRLQLAPADVIAEINDVAGETSTLEVDNAFPFRLIVRRIRFTHNSLGRTFASVQKRGGQNHLYVHPDDLQMLGMREGDRVQMIASKEAVPASVAADPTMRRGVVSMTHCWGLLPEDPYSQVGVSTSRLVRTDVRVEAINAMPAMSAIPVRIVAERNLRDRAAFAF